MNGGPEGWDFSGTTEQYRSIIFSYTSHNLFSSKFLSFTIYPQTERTMAQLLPQNVKTNFI